MSDVHNMRPDDLPTAPGGRLTAALQAIRPRHWAKNVFVLAPLLFAGRFGNLNSWACAMVAFAAFSLIASAVYLMNDVCDRHSDRADPNKSHRPIASGRLSPGAAITLAVLLLAGAAAMVAALEVWGRAADGALAGIGLIVSTGGYLLLNLAYSLWLREKAIIDAIIIAFGFMLRAVAGASAINVPISPWLLLCTFTLCLPIGLNKRRYDIHALPTDIAGTTRAANVIYTERDIDHMTAVTSALAIATYSLYCLAPRTVQQLGSPHMVWTIPLVVYGIFRYQTLSRRSRQGDPVALLFRDKVMWLVLVLYACVSGLVVKYGSAVAFRSLLDSEVLGK